MDTNHATFDKRLFTVSMELGVSLNPTPFFFEKKLEEFVNTKLLSSLPIRKAIMDDRRTGKTTSMLLAAKGKHA